MLRNWHNMWIHTTPRAGWKQLLAHAAYVAYMHMPFIRWERSQTDRNKKTYPREFSHPRFSTGNIPWEIEQGDVRSFITDGKGKKFLWLTLLASNGTPDSYEKQYLCFSIVLCSGFSCLKGGRDIKSFIAGSQIPCLQRV